VAEGGVGRRGGLQLLPVRQTVCHQVQPESAQPRPHGGAAVHLPRLRQGVQAEGTHAEALLGPPPQDTRGWRCRCLIRALGGVS
jgi:hypothetical protein